MNKVLVVEDDKEYAKFVKNLLIDECEVDHIEHKSELLAASMEDQLKKYSLIIFDLFLDDDNGISLFQKLKSVLGPQMPLSVLISERASQTDRLQAFESYFFDFINKDYPESEIKLRLLKALHYSKEFMGHISSEGLRLDLDSQSVIIEGVKPNLTQIEFKILSNCASNARGIRKDLLIKKVWDDQLVLNQTLNVHIHNLNKKIKFSKRKVTISSSGVVSFTEIN